MRRVVLALAVTAAVAVLVPVASAAMTVKFTTVLKQHKETANGFLLREDILRNGRTVGQGSATCKYYPPRAAQPEGGFCRMIVSLPDGTLRLTGRLPFDHPGGQLKVVGGTGKFAGASGRGTYRALSTRRSAVTLRIG